MWRPRAGYRLSYPVTMKEGAALAQGPGRFEAPGPVKGKGWPWRRPIKKCLLMRSRHFTNFLQTRENQQDSDSFGRPVSWAGILEWLVFS